MKKICDNITGLSFICKTNNNVDFLKSDKLDLKCNSYSFLMHLALSISVNPSLMILNNTILGLPADELKKLIYWFMPFGQLQNVLNNRDSKMRQVIVIDRLTNNYRPILEEKWPGLNFMQIND